MWYRQKGESLLKIIFSNVIFAIQFIRQQEGYSKGREQLSECVPDRGIVQLEQLADFSNKHHCPKWCFYAFHFCTIAQSQLFGSACISKDLDILLPALCLICTGRNAVLISTGRQVFIRKYRGRSISPP